MTARAEPGGDPGARGGLGEIGALAFVLLSYLVILFFLQLWPEPSGTWARLSIPSLWLLATGSAWALLRPRAWSLVSVPGRRAWAQAAVVAATLVAWVAVSANVGTPGLASDFSRAASVRYLLLVLLVPAAEELYFRGLLLHGLRRPFGPVAALVLSAALFAFLHFPQGNAFPMALLGLVTGAVALLTGSLLGAVAVHMAWNAASLRLEVGTIPPGAINDLSAVAVLLVAGALGLRRGLSKHGSGPEAAAREEAGPA